MMAATASTAASATALAVALTAALVLSSLESSGDVCLEGLDRCVGLRPANAINRAVVEALVLEEPLLLLHRRQLAADRGSPVTATPLSKRGIPAHTRAGPRRGVRLGRLRLRRAENLTGARPWHKSSH